jgi:hypothetical protein
MQCTAAGNPEQPGQRALHGRGGGFEHLPAVAGGSHDLFGRPDRGRCPPLLSVASQAAASRSSRAVPRIAGPAFSVRRDWSRCAVSAGDVSLLLALRAKADSHEGILLAAMSGGWGKRNPGAAPGACHRGASQGVKHARPECGPGVQPDRAKPCRSSAPVGWFSVLPLRIPSISRGRD